MSQHEETEKQFLRNAG